jgi:hypothetical protein
MEINKNNFGLVIMKKNNKISFEEFARRKKIPLGSLTYDKALKLAHEVGAEIPKKEFWPTKEIINHLSQQSIKTTEASEKHEDVIVETEHIFELINVSNEEPKVENIDIEEELTLTEDKQVIILPEPIINEKREVKPYNNDYKKNRRR